MKRFYVPQLDGLRFLAFLLVFIHHGPAFHTLWPEGSLPHRFFGYFKEWGWCGVDLFLVLSAFLITTLLLFEYEAHSRISLKQFYIRRMLRIWPLYYFMATLGFFVFPLLGKYAAPWGSPEFYETLKHHLIPYYTLFGNYSSGVFGYVPTLTLSHLWTVTLEEQFYIVWPLLMGRLLLVRGETVRWAVLAGLIGCSLILRSLLSSQFKHPFVWTNTVMRLDPLVLGAGLAFWRFKRAANSSWPWVLLKLILGCLLVFTTSFGPKIDAASWNAGWQLFFTAVGFTFVLDAILGDRTNPLAVILASRPLVWLGKLTYGLYVYHLLALQIAPSVTKRLAALLGGGSLAFRLTVEFLVAFVLTVVISALSFRHFEAYFLRLKGKFSLVQSRPVGELAGEAASARPGSASAGESSPSEETKS